MASYNRVILMGNITRDIELKYIRSDMAVTEIGMAINERRKNQAGESIDETVFVEVTLWGRTAEIASEYLGKGAPVMIEGRLKFDTWETEGQKRSKLRVVGEKLVMLPRGSAGSGPGNTGGANRSPASPEFDESDFSKPEFGKPEFSSAGPTASSRPQAQVGPPKDDIPF